KLFGAGCRGDFTDDTALLVEHLIATADVLRRNAVSIEYHHPAVIHITIEFGGLRQNRSQQAQQQYRATDQRCAPAQLQSVRSRIARGKPARRAGAASAERHRPDTPALVSGTQY